MKFNWTKAFLGILIAIVIGIFVGYAFGVDERGFGAGMTALWALILAAVFAIIGGSQS